MTSIYLKGYYGYRNFGDEILLFGVVRRIFSRYPEAQLDIEAGDAKRLQNWLETNQKYLPSHTYKKIQVIQIGCPGPKRWRQLKHLLGFAPSRKKQKIFGGGEVLSDERKCPHDGRNILLLFFWTVISGNFILLGGVGTPKKRTTKFLYGFLLPRAQEIVTRDFVSYMLIKKHNTAVSLTSDFSEELLQRYVNKLEFSETPYHLINLTPSTFTQPNIEKIKKQVKTKASADATCRFVYFPCDMNDDIHVYPKLKSLLERELSELKNLEIYNWTQYSVSENLNFLRNAQSFIGARLHFLLPAKYWGIAYISLSGMEKIKKLIGNGDEC